MGGSGALSTVPWPIHTFKRLVHQAKSESAVKSVLSVINNASVETETGGAFISRFGNEQWLYYRIGGQRRLVLLFTIITGT